MIAFIGKDDLYDPRHQVIGRIKSGHPWPHSSSPVRSSMIAVVGEVATSRHLSCVWRGSEAAIHGRSPHEREEQANS
ncbi:MULTISPECIES: hypothetical protein [Rhodanobacter]|uniref:hypothetical protein n=1 Tax=Rhodanobacter TaxID=75309 RepID=UPI00120DEB11|nr:MULTISPECIES: hypothetical protein [Rhodanobacter]TAN17624.1 MAG: hypothetical protein EPN35_06490 [Rhodanobacter sp.]UJJ53971.1 hypothetical protein LRK53_13520 [Rhodanobacter thiooxydans]